MHDNDDHLLEGLSMRELLDLQARIHDAIRAHIRMKNAKMAAAAGPRSAQPVHLPQVEQIRRRSLVVYASTRQAEEAPPLNTHVNTGEQPETQDAADELKRERDAWLARKRASST